MGHKKTAKKRKKTVFFEKLNFFTKIDQSYQLNLPKIYDNNRKNKESNLLKKKSNRLRKELDGDKKKMHHACR